MSITVQNDVTSKHSSGMGWIITAFLLVAELVGSGVVALPAAILRTGQTLSMIIAIYISLFLSSTNKINLINVE